MYAAEITIKNELGLHARPAQMLAEESVRFNSDIIIIKDGVQYNGKSILGIMSMGAAKGDKLIFQAYGKDEKEAVDTLVRLIENKFDE